MKLTSSAFENNSPMPISFTGAGKNISPPLSWSDAPPQTASFVLIMDDDDAIEVIGKPFDHWALYDVPGTCRSLPEGIPTIPQLPDGARQGVTTRDAIGYMGAYPPPNKPPHHYVFTLYALDCMLNLEPGQTKATILDHMKGHTLATASLCSTFSRSA